MGISIIQHIQLSDISDAVDYNDAEELIKMIDKAQEDWDFTKSIATYFLLALKELEAENVDMPPEEHFFLDKFISSI